MGCSSNADRGEIFIASPKRQKQLWVQAVFCSVASGVLPRVRWTGDDVEHPRPSIIEFKNDWSCNFVPPFVFMAWKGTI
jgi:hypothetical protein